MDDEGYSDVPPRVRDSVGAIAYKLLNCAHAKATDGKMVKETMLEHVLIEFMCEKLHG